MRSLGHLISSPAGIATVVRSEQAPEPLLPAAVAAVATTTKARARIPSLA